MALTLRDGLAVCGDDCIPQSLDFGCGLTDYSRMDYANDSPFKSRSADPWPDPQRIHLLGSKVLIWILRLSPAASTRTETATAPIVAIPTETSLALAVSGTSTVRILPWPFSIFRCTRRIPRNKNFLPRHPFNLFAALFLTPRPSYPKRALLTARCRQRGPIIVRQERPPPGLARWVEYNLQRYQCES